MNFLKFNNILRINDERSIKYFSTAAITLKVQIEIRDTRHANQ